MFPVTGDTTVSYQVLIGINVLNNESFVEFHSAIQPVLYRYEGEFSYDIDVPSTLLTGRVIKINHIYTLRFTSRVKMEEFFSDREYLLVRGRHILKSFRPEQFIFGYDQ